MCVLEPSQTLFQLSKHSTWLVLLFVNATKNGFSIKPDSILGFGSHTHTPVSHRVDELRM